MRRFALPRLSLLLAFAVGAHSVGVRAEIEPPLTEDIFLADLPKVLSATRLPQPLSETPASVTVIDRRMIESSGALDIPEILRLVPGFQISPVNNGNLYTVTYHGLSDAYARRMQVLVDGRSVYTASFGGVQWGEIPLALEDIERIEVVRGPNGVTYGANAFAAVINIITREPADVRGGYAKLTHGSAHTRNGLLRYGGASDNFDYRLTAEHREDDGFSVFPDERRTNLFSYRGDYRASGRDVIETQFGYSGGPRGEGSYIDATDPPRVERTLNHFEQIRWRRSLAADELSVQFYHNYYRTSDAFRVSGVTVNEDLKSERYDLELEHRLRLNESWRVVWGAEARLDRIGGQGWFDTSKLIDSKLYRLFSNAEWRPAPDWIWNAGLMFEHNDITGGDVSPRLALNHHLDRHHTVRVSASRAYRTPSLIEHQANTIIRFDNGVIVPDGRFVISTVQLRPERITAYELGYLGEFPALNLFTDLKIYREKIRDAIAFGRDSTSVPGDPFLTFRNDGETDIDGAELQLTLRPAPRTRIVYAHAYAHQRGRILDDVSPATYESTHSSTPVHTRSLFVEHEVVRDLRASLAYYKLSAMRFFGGDQQPDTDTLDARLAWRFRMGNTRAEIAAVGRNLNGDYTAYEDRAVLTKRYFINLSLETR